MTMPRSLLLRTTRTELLLLRLSLSPPLMPPSLLLLLDL